jgi:hypothetical protein
VAAHNVGFHVAAIISVYDRTEFTVRWQPPTPPQTIAAIQQKLASGCQCLSVSELPMQQEFYRTAGQSWSVTVYADCKAEAKETLKMKREVLTEAARRIIAEAEPEYAHDICRGASFGNSVLGEVIAMTQGVPRYVAEQCVVRALDLDKAGMDLPQHRSIAVPNMSSLSAGTPL